MGGSLTQTAARNRKGLKGLENKPQTKKVKGSLVNKLVSPDKYILEQGKQEYCKTKQTLETIETLTPEETKEDLQWLHNLKDSFDSL